MKTKSKLLLLSAILFANVSINAQTTPTVSTKYSTEQIETMYINHEIENAIDVYTPPAKLLEKFNLDFPKARGAEWEQSSGLYEVEFEIGWIGDTEHKAYYDMEGNLIMYKAEISENDLPGVVKNAAQAKYPNFRFDDLRKIVKGEQISYKVEMKKGNHDVELLVLNDGTIANQSID